MISALGKNTVWSHCVDLHQPQYTFITDGFSLTKLSRIVVSDNRDPSLSSLLVSVVFFASDAPSPPSCYTWLDIYSGR